MTAPEYGSGLERVAGWNPAVVTILKICNIMQKSRDNHWKEVKDSYKKLHDEAYFVGFHRGRRKERDKLVNCGWLMINPEKREEFEKALAHPCVGCKYYADDLKIACLKNPAKCPDMQRNLLAYEVKQYFDK